MFIKRVVHQFTKYNIPYAIVGGHAVALHKAVRGTINVDFITKWKLKNLILIEKAMLEINLVSRLPIKPEDLFNFKDEYINNRNLIAWNFINVQNPSEQVDLIITHNLTARSIKKIKLGENDIAILKKENLIEMKLESGRDQDLLDVNALRRLK